MKIIRVYINKKITNGFIELDQSQTHYIKNVMRSSIGDNFNIFNAPLNWKVYIFLPENDPRELINLKHRKLEHINYISFDYSIEDNKENLPFTGFGISKVISISRFLKRYFENEVISFKEDLNTRSLNVFLLKGLNLSLVEIGSLNKIISIISSYFSKTLLNELLKVPDL